MTTVEVLSPVRLETRFLPPGHAMNPTPEWLLRLRVYPDEFSMPRPAPAATSAELDALTDAVGTLTRTVPATPQEAFADFAGAVGATRALVLWRRHVGGTPPAVDRSGEAEGSHFAPAPPVGLPPTLEAWFVHSDGTRTLEATLTPDGAAIAADLNLEQKFTAALGRKGKLPTVWWLDYARAVQVGLAADIPIGAIPPTLDALVVVGVGDTDASALVSAHNASGRMAILPQGTPTNTVSGEPTTDFGDSAVTLFPLLDVSASDQPASISALTALTGTVAADALPMLGDDPDALPFGRADQLVVQSLWPALWGHYLRDVTGAAREEYLASVWAASYLRPQGPRPAIRVGDEPYGLLPTSAFSAWTDPAAGVYVEPSIERRILTWATAWRAGAAASARENAPHVVGADARGLFDVLGLTAPSPGWSVNAIDSFPILQMLRAISGTDLLDPTWDDATAAAFRSIPYPLSPAAEAPGRMPLPGDPERGDSFRELLKLYGEQLLGGQPDYLGFLGRLFREALREDAAFVGLAAQDLSAAGRVTLGRAIDWHGQAQPWISAVASGSQFAADTLSASGDAQAGLAARAHDVVRKSMQELVDNWDANYDLLHNATLAALDTAAFRIDPWLTGIAEHRLRDMITAGSPFKLGAFGWVDAPAPYGGPADGTLAPGPTPVGLLHAPSPEQAAVAALLRDAAVRYPDDDRWNLTIDSRKVRASVSFADQVRLGLHPYEALGLEVERVIGDWTIVQQLRTQFPLTSDDQQRRVCDGQAVLAAARQLPAPAWLTPAIADDLLPLGDVLDTYADLLVADGVHALVTGHSSAANAAMEAAAGLGAPPDLRSIRTPRRATTVRVAAWAVLPSGPSSGGDDAHPLVVADPAFAAQLTADFGSKATDADRRSLSAVLGGTEEKPPLPSLVGGHYEGIGTTADARLRAAIGANLGKRLARLLALAEKQAVALGGLDPAKTKTPATITTAASRWHVALGDVVASDPTTTTPSVADLLAAVSAEIADRIARATGVPAVADPDDGWLSLVRAAIRTLVGRPDLPVLPIVARTLLPRLRATPTMDSQWLEIVAAVHPRLAALEARQFDPSLADWKSAIAAPAKSTDPWHPSGPVLVAYGPGVGASSKSVALAVLDAWTDSVPSRRHVTTAAFGFNAPKSRAPQTVLLAVPPDPGVRLDNAGLLQVILETRELAQARAARPIPGELPFATPTAMVVNDINNDFLNGWARK